MTFPRLKLRRRAVFTNLGRPRVGLSESEIAAKQAPHAGVLVMAGAKRGRAANTAARTTHRK